MNDELTRWLMVVGAFVVVAGSLFLSHYLGEKRRTERWREVAAATGMGFSKKDGDLTQRTLSEFKILQPGGMQVPTAKNVVRTRVESSEVVVFLYEFMQRGRSGSYTRQTVGAIRTPHRSLPGFRLVREGFFSKLLAGLGAQDLDFESDPQFSSAYRVTGSDEAAVRRLFNPEVRAFFASRQDWLVEGAGPWLVMYRAGHRIGPDPGQLQSFITEVRTISDLFGSA